MVLFALRHSTKINAKIAGLLALRAERSKQKALYNFDLAMNSLEQGSPNNDPRARYCPRRLFVNDEKIIYSILTKNLLIW